MGLRRLRQVEKKMRWPNKEEREWVKPRWRPVHVEKTRGTIIHHPSSIDKRAHTLVGNHRKILRRISQITKADSGNYSR